MLSKTVPTVLVLYSKSLLFWELELGFETGLGLTSRLRLEPVQYTLLSENFRLSDIYFLINE